jgi:hypothetical protein
MSVATPQMNEISPIVRDRVQHILSQSEAYWALPREQQVTLANDMYKVAAYIAGGADGTSVPRAATLRGSPAASARALANPPFDPAGQTAGQRFAQAGAVAAQQGTAAYTGMIQSVNFPSFVAGLIDGVFNAIVTASIKQMNAYAELVKNVAKSVDDYMKDNVSANQARDYLANRYPDHLEVDTSGDSPTLKPKEGSDDSSLPDFFKDLGLAQPVQSLDEDTTEQVLVPGARRRIAMDRQQLLATMVLMGINRLIVTDGNIEASCTFSLDTTDRVTRHYDRASSYDRQVDYSEKGGGWFTPDYEYKSSAHFNVSTHQSEDSEDKVKLHAQLGGKVRVNFRSDVFPLEKMADVLQINQIQQKAPNMQPPAVAPAAAPTTPAAAPATPAPTQPAAGR